MKRTTHDLVQGSDEWKAFRATAFTASDAPAMMGVSKYKTRDQLLAEKFTGISPPVDAHMQKIFDKGHGYEAIARPWAEEIVDGELYTPTMSIELDGMLIAASLDGITMLEDVIWEHKTLNKNLAAKIPLGIIDDQYAIQMEQQMLVSGAEDCLFMASSGIYESMVSHTYFPDLELRASIVAGWKQFAVDLANYKPKATAEKVVGVDSDSLPAIVWDITGSNIATNFDHVIPELQERATEEMAKDLITDQDFADKDSFNKLVKQSRAGLKDVASAVKSRFDSYAQFESKCAEVDGILQKLQSHGEKAVKDKKAELKTKIVFDAGKVVIDFSQEISKTIDPIELSQVIDLRLDYTTAMKGKRTLVSMESAVNDLLADFKIKANEVANKVRANLAMLASNDEHKMLFADTLNLVIQTPDALDAIIKSRIADHEDLQKIAAAKEEIAKAEEVVKVEPEPIKRDTVETPAPEIHLSAVELFDLKFKVGQLLAKSMVQFIHDLQK